MGATVSGKPQKTYIIESKGGGAGLFDYDNDGNLDAYLINGSSFDPLPDPPPGNRLYRNRGDGTFAEVTRTAGVGDTAWSMGCGVCGLRQRRRRRPFGDQLRTQPALPQSGRWDL